MRKPLRRRIACSAKVAAVVAALVAFSVAASAEDPVRFVLLGDRTGETVAGIYERIWKQVAAEHPAFVVSAGDTIQGLKDSTAEREWQEVRRILEPYRRIPLYLTPGNHDIWSAISEELFRRYAGHALHYSFDYGPAHFTILDNSRSDELLVEELHFLESDLAAHASQPLKFVVSHRPSWITEVAFQNPAFPLHRVAKKYGVRYVIAGHIHVILNMQLEGITYISLPSAGGQLRLSGKYEDGWFFGYTLAEVRGGEVHLQIHELGGRTTNLADWGNVGLVTKPAQ